MSEIVGAERDALLLEILKRLEIAKPHADSEAWDRNWQNALDDFRATGNIVPPFITQATVRKDGAFWRGVNELDYVREVQNWLTERLALVQYVYEFGCGTGFNLIPIAGKYAGKTCIGYDKSEASVLLSREVGLASGTPILTGVFDMLAPSGAMLPRAGVFTFGAMEQLGRFEPFIEWLIAQQPEKVIHVEPIPELLDENNLLDWLSLQFHKKRGYTVGLLPYLQSHPKIEVLHVERSHFGSLMLESYARIVWRPK